MAMQSLIKIDRNHNELERFIHFYNVNRNQNLVLIQTGCQNNCHSMQIRPRVRDHYLLHFVISGSGCLHLQNASYPVNANECFLIYPNELSSYHSIDGGTWGYYWIGIAGEFAKELIARAGFQSDRQVMHFTNLAVFDTLKQLVDTAMLYQNDLYGLELTSNSLIYQLFAILYAEKKEERLSFHAPIVEDNSALFGLGSSSRQWVSAVITLIQDNYGENLRVDNIADTLHLNRSYLSALFKQETGISIKQYLSSYRIEAAKNKLLKTGRSITEISYQCGFKDPLYFSRIFKEKVGCSPSEFRQSSSFDAYDSRQEADGGIDIERPPYDDFFIAYL